MEQVYSSKGWKVPYSNIKTRIKIMHNMGYYKRRGVPYYETLVSIGVAQIKGRSIISCNEVLYTPHLNEAAIKRIVRVANRTRDRAIKVKGIDW